MNLEAIRRTLREHGQEHLLAFWERLDDVQRARLLRQITELDWAVVDRMRTLAQEPAPAGGGSALPPAPVARLTSGEREALCRVGEAALRANQVGVVLVAGGQGTRLGFDGPKGTFPIAPITGASLFAIHARKILALERRYGCAIPFYIMTSPGNDAETRRFFAAHGCWGLCSERVQFFVQGTHPAFWPDGRIVLEAPDRLALSPDGHGGVLAALARHGMLADMARRSVTTVFYFQVDNPLVEIADPTFLGLHLEGEAEMSLKVCAKREPTEGLGVVVQRPDGRHAVVEYTEFTPEQQQARRPDGELVYKFGSMAIHVFAADFLRREARVGLPLHRAHKKVPYCDAQGQTVKPGVPNAFKFEKFIFDALPDAANPVVLETAREDEFAPVKNATGPDSPETVRQAMMEKFARWLRQCGVELPRQDGRLRYRVEIDPGWANGPEELRARLPGALAVHGDLLLAETGAEGGKACGPCSSSLAASC